MRITREIATQVAKKLTEKKLKEVSELQNDLLKSFTEIVKKTIPAEVIEFHKKHKGYVNERISVQLHGNGWEWQTLSFSEPLPLKERAFVPKPKDSDLLLNKHNAYEEARRSLLSLVEELENVLYNLRTYSKVNLEFPEATPFLPSAKEAGLMVNINDVRKKLQ